MLESTDHRCKRKRYCKGRGAENKLQGEGRKRWQNPQHDKAAKSYRTTLQFLHGDHQLGMKTSNFSKKEHGVGWLGVRE